MGKRPHSIAEQRAITDGRVIPVGKEGFIRKPPKRVDYLLRYTRDFPIAVAEAKASYKTATDAVQQARLYTEMLDLQFAYATNVTGIIETDYFTGTENKFPAFPSRTTYGTAIRWEAELRAREGRDDPTAYELIQVEIVSIHAPARGATGTAPRFLSALPKFQSTRPRGARLQHLAASLEPFVVSIHAPARGATCVRMDATSPLIVSIHAPARGATTPLRVRELRKGVSIHAPARGATHAARLCDRPLFVSIHAPARGATSTPRRWRWQCQSFNPRAREGRDVAESGYAEWIDPVSIHAPARGATEGVQA